MFKASAFALRSVIAYVRENIRTPLDYSFRYFGIHGLVGVRGLEAYYFSSDDFSIDISVLQVGNDHYTIKVDEGMMNDIEIKCDRAQAKFFVNSLKQMSKP